MKFLHHRVQKWLILLLGALLSFLAIIAWQHHSIAQQANPTLQTALLTVEKIGDRVYTLISDTDYPPKNPNIAICNAGIVIGSDGVLVIDPFQNAALGNLLLAEVKKLTDLPVSYVLNTHYHFDHTGGNGAIKAREIPIVGRGSIREDMLEKNRQYDPNPVPPDLIINGDDTIWLGDREIKLTAVEGHSSGTDVVAYVPDAKVLFTGDILFNQKIPYISDGNILQWQQTLDNLIATYPDATIVPGHGKVTDRSGLVALKTYLKDLESLALSWQEKSLTQEEAISSSSQIPDAYKNYRFQNLYPTNLEAAYQQITLQ